MQRWLDPQVKNVWRVAAIIQSVMGLTMGLYLFTWGPLFNEKFALVVDEKSAMTFTTLLFGIHMGLIAFLEVPTGALGDALGRKKTVVWSFVGRMLFFLLLAFVPLVDSPYTIFALGILAMLVFSVSYTLYSGSFTAWCVDSLRSADPELGYEHVLSRAYTYNFVFQIVGGVLGVVLYLQKIPYVGFLLAAVLSVGAVAFCLGEMKDDEKNVYVNWNRLGLQSILRRMGEILGVGFQVFRRSQPILALVAIYASYLFLINLIEYLWPVYLRNRVPLSMQGYYWVGFVALILASCTIGSQGLQTFVRIVGKLRGVSRTENATLHRCLIFTCLASSVPILYLSWLTSQGADTLWIFAMAVLLVEASYGVIAPTFETLVNNYIPESHSQERATILSFGSLARSLLIMLLAIPSGGQSGGTTTIGWALPACLLLASACFGHFVLRRAETRRAEGHEGAVEDATEEKPLIGH